MMNAAYVERYNRIINELPQLAFLVDQSHQEWMERGACFRAGPEITSLFFPLKGQSFKEAKAICNNGPCPVRTDCLNYALQHPNLIGIWGGTTGRERIRMRKGKTAA